MKPRQISPYFFIALLFSFPSVVLPVNSLMPSPAQSPSNTQKMRPLHRSAETLNLRSLEESENLTKKMESLHISYSEKNAEAIQSPITLSPKKSPFNLKRVHSSIDTLAEYTQEERLPIKRLMTLAALPAIVLTIINR